MYIYIYTYICVCVCLYWVLNTLVKYVKSITKVVYRRNYITFHALFATPRYRQCHLILTC